MAYGAILGQSPNQALTQQLQQHVTNFNNPHQVTTTQIGAATETALNQHVGNTNNPHQVTAGQIGAAPTVHTHDAGAIVSGTLPVARGGTGIATNPSMLVNLGVGTADSVFKNSPRPGVTGVLPVTNGGTGANNAAQARTNLGITPDNIGALPLAGGTMSGQINMNGQFIINPGDDLGDSDRCATVNQLAYNYCSVYPHIFAKKIDKTVTDVNNQLQGVIVINPLAGRYGGVYNVAGIFCLVIAYAATPLVPSEYKMDFYFDGQYYSKSLKEATVNILYPSTGLTFNQSGGYFTASTSGIYMVDIVFTV